jgi:hypothetical protein
MADNFKFITVRLADDDWDRDGKYPRPGESAFGDNRRQSKLDYRRALAHS